MTCLLTWPCYAKSVGLRLPPLLLEWRRNHCRYPPFLLGEELRREVLEAILEAAAAPRITLLAVHVRETHVHVVIDSNRSPSIVGKALKSAATRRLRARGLVDPARPIWADYLNVRPLRTREAILHAIHYVVEKQGSPMALWHIPSAIHV